MSFLCFAYFTWKWLSFWAILSQMIGFNLFFNTASFPFYICTIFLVHPSVDGSLLSLFSRLGFYGQCCSECGCSGGLPPSYFVAFGMELLDHVMVLFIILLEVLMSIWDIVLIFMYLWFKLLYNYLISRQNNFLLFRCFNSVFFLCCVYLS